MKRYLLFYLAATAIAVFTQGFQCASSELATARKAIQQQDYLKAKAALERATAANPKDCDALLLLGDVNDRLKDRDASIDAYKRARECPGLKSEQQTLISVNLFNLWVAEYNAGIADYNDYAETMMTEKLVTSKEHLERAAIVKPEFSDPYVLLGQVQELLTDTNAAVITYQKWWEIERPGFELLKSKGVTIGASRGSVIKALGTPVTTRMDSVGTAIMYKDRFDVGGRDLITFATSQPGADAILEGWTYNLPTTVAEPEKWRARYASVSPLKSMAFVSYQRGAYNDALTWVNLVGTYKPSDQDLVPLRTQLLQNLGKTDEAMREAEQQVERDPKSVTARLQFAGMLSAAGRYDESVTQYLAVVEIEPTNESALYNLGANYKNIASSKQRAELEKLDKNKKYVPDTTYLNDLRSSATYFERLRKSSVKYRDDIVVLEQLANVYEVRKDQARVQAIIRELEALEDKYRTNKDYYRVMEGLYGRSKMIDKMKEAQSKGAKL